SSLHIHGKHSFYDDMSTDDVTQLNIEKLFYKFPLLNEICIQFLPNQDNQKIVKFFKQYILYAPKLNKLNIVFGYIKIDYNLLIDLLNHFIIISNNNNNNNNNNFQKLFNIKYLFINTIACSYKSNIKLLLTLAKYFDKLCLTQDFKINN